jgi:hypothetical protein
MKMTTKNSASNIRVLVYVLPLLHLCACLVIEALHSGWQPIALADYPISTPALALAYQFNTTAFPFFLVIGTLWWYLISRIGLFTYARIANRREGIV